LIQPAAPGADCRRPTGPIFYDLPEQLYACGIHVFDFSYDQDYVEIAHVGKTLLDASKTSAPAAPPATHERAF